jgi:glycosyltransferase involved in cell wall biosynthesis
MNRSDLSFLESIFQQPLSDITANILVINQSDSDTITANFENIKVINSSEFGLSKSRNLAITNSSAALCWIMDDDCVILPDAINNIIEAHHRIPSTIITFQTETTKKEKLYYNYFSRKQSHTKKSLYTVLSPEITFKRKGLLGQGLKFNESFGLGADFQDSENFVFLNDAFYQDRSPYFYNQTVVRHEELNSSQEAANDRVIYARGAIAAYLKHNITFKKWKYGFFLFRKGLVLSTSELRRKIKTFENGANDYLKSIN